MNWYELWVEEQIRRALWVVGIIVGLAAAALLFAGCTAAEKGAVRTAVDVVKAVCTPEQTLDACIDRVLSDQRVKAARAERMREATGGAP